MYRIRWWDRVRPMYEWGMAARAVAGVVFVTVILGLAVIVGMKLSLPDDAQRAAIAQYQARAHLTDVDAIGAAGWSHCAVIGMADHHHTEAWVIVVKQQDHWNLASIANGRSWSDSDDVYDQETCLDLASNQ